MADAETLRSRLNRKPIVVAPGVYDALTALIATQAGFTTLYVSGAAIAYTRLGRPDVGLVSMSEVADTLALIRDRVDAHLIVDADTGYGNALNVARTVRCARADGRPCHTDRRPGLSETLRPSRRQGSDPGAGDVRQDPRGGRCAAFARDADHRTHRRGGGGRRRTGDRTRQALPRCRRRRAVRGGAEDARRSGPHRFEPWARAFRCWRTWSKAARRRRCPRPSWRRSGSRW